MISARVKQHRNAADLVGSLRRKVDELIRAQGCPSDVARLAYHHRGMGTRLMGTILIPASAPLRKRELTHLGPGGPASAFYLP